MGKIHLSLLGIGMAGILVLAGCATKGYVKEQVGLAMEQTNQVRQLAQENQKEIQALKQGQEASVRQIGQEIGGLKKEVQLAKDLAQEAANMARQAMVKAGDLERLISVRKNMKILASEEIIFEFDKFKLGKEARGALKKLIQQMKDNPEALLEIEGYTDTMGKDGYNLLLGYKRAESVRQFLAKEHNIELTRMIAISYGEAYPAAEGKDKTARAKNRRVVLRLLG
jgi:outer membrane protein OmpA-like peptidoglycan-associated protein